MKLITLNPIIIIFNHCLTVPCSSSSLLVFVNPLEPSLALFLTVLLSWLPSSSGEERIEQIWKPGLFFLDSTVEIFWIVVGSFYF